MKVFGIFAIVGGVAWCIFAYNLNATVTTGDLEVYNIGLMEARRNHFMLAGLSVLIGVILLGFGNIQNSSDIGNLKKCPKCAELIQPDAKKCRYCSCDLPELRSMQSSNETTIKNPEIEKDIWY